MSLAFWSSENVWPYPIRSPSITMIPVGRCTCAFGAAGAGAATGGAGREYAATIGAIAQRRASAGCEFVCSRGGLNAKRSFVLSSAIARRSACVGLTSSVTVEVVVELS